MELDYEILRIKISLRFIFISGTLNNTNLLDEITILR